ncbi:putative NAD(P)H nitroreductase YdjA [Novipirellula galeiformis]|uniref:Putative NAD(P)H nitroreductase n=1 Tax=Novipirellula galeiformis TaxID=2528004 RepID=A0A5C6CU65_9BACT|nr:nitroreductase [Novipirellula galeiformis]TWU26576.1 putative NAD(P)H nitroreductase YdjA [Novipirellula galeiformis]
MLSVSQVIRDRRTIKPTQYSNRDVDEKIVYELLENANWAPTHGMTEPWRFTVFSGDARNRLAEFMTDTYKSLTTEETFKQKKYDGMRENAIGAPVVIAIGMKRQASEKISLLDELLAVACAVQNMHLTATAHGLGGFWSTNLVATSIPMRDFIGLGENDQALGLFYLGYPKGDWPESSRGAMADKVRWVRD